ncbi:MAG: NUDIX hydrolase [Candidatus Hydrogenedentes bacterium]|nr:NUDIX hydrolase [Candidatus Hydrogenedentota bacterium]
MFASSVVIRNENDEILLVREADPRVYGKLNLPGGHAEEGESPVDTACREVHEEVGLDIQPSGLLGIYRHAGGGLNYVFLARADEGTEPVPAPEDILSAEWYSVSEILALPENQFFRYRKLRAILGDLQANRHFPCDIIRDIPPESWEN